MGDKLLMAPGQPPGERTRQHPWRRRLFLLAAALLGLAPAVTREMQENFGTILAGCAYRSSQLDAGALTRRIDQYQLRSIINLRGSHPQDEWYQAECEVAARRGVAYYDLSIDSQSPFPNELHALIGILDGCPKPVILHCMSGIDRTGIGAVTCILLLDESGTPARAEEQLGWRYFQLPWRANCGCQVKFLDLYRHWLSQKGLTHSRARFREWALNDYARPSE